MAGNRKSLIERLLSRVDKESSPDGCWLWTGARNGDPKPYNGGYGVIWVENIYVDGHRVQVFERVHLVTYRHFIGPIPEGHYVDHVWERGCRNRHCCNPEHLEAVPPRENTMRGVAAKKERAHAEVA